jgi:hypothetical protein
MDAGRRARAAAPTFAAACALGLALSLVTLWPLVAKLERSAHDALDPLFQAWTIDWVQGAIPAGWDRIWDANSFWPERSSLAFSDSLLGLAVPLLPLRWLGLEPIGVLNAGVVLAFASSFVAAFYVGRAATGSRALGAVVGAVFAFGPFGAASSGHVHVAARAGLALAVLGVWRLATRPWRSASWWGGAVLLAAAVFWQGTISVYQVTAALLAVAAVTVVLWRSLSGRGVAVVLASVLVGLAALTPLAARYLDVRAEQPEFRWTLSDVESLGARFGEVEPSVLLWGGVLAADRPEPTFAIDAFPGLTALVLAAVGLAGGRRNRSDRRAWSCGAALVAIGVAFAVGAGDDGWRRWTPFAIAFRFVPFASGVRAPGRLAVVAMLGLGLLAATGVRVLVARAGRPQQALRVVAAIAVLAATAEGLRSWSGTEPLAVAPVDEEIAARADEGAVLYLPVNADPERLDITLWRQPRFLYRSTEHRRPVPNGYAAYAPPSYLALSRRMAGLPEPEAVACLRHLGVRYVVVTRYVIGTPWEPLLHDPPEAGPLRTAGHFGDEVLLEVSGNPVASRSARPEPCGPRTR